jgi:heat shock protein HslJ
MDQFRHLLLIVFTACAFAACSGGGNVSTNPADIQGEWELTSINGNEIQPTADDGAYTISFNPDSTIAGRADCNYYAGKYTASQTEEQGSLNLEGVSTTKVECGEQSEFRTFVKSVINAESFQVAGGEQLVLSSGNDNKVVFTRLEAEEQVQPEEQAQPEQEGP